jgi:hypothetical protein
MTVSTTSGNIGARAGIMAVDAMCWRRGFDPWWKRVMTVSLFNSASRGSGARRARPHR